MKNLLKADFFRLRKEKTALVGFIVGTVISLLTVVMFLLLKAIISLSGDTSFEITSGFALFKVAFQPTNNAGMVILIIRAILLIKEFNQKNIRQKIIFGYSRTKIFFSSLIVYTIYSLGILIFTAFLNLLLGGALFGFGFTGGFWLIVKDIFIMLGLNVLIFLVYLYITLFFGYLTNSIGGTIAIIFGLTVVFTIVHTVFSALASNYDWANFFVKINPANATQLLVLSPSVSLKDSLYIIFSSLFYITGMSALSLLVINKKDIK